MPLNPTRSVLRGALLCTGLVALAPFPAFAQDSAAQMAGETDPNFDDEQDIIVTGQRERGAVIGDIKPETQLDAADVQALGVSTLTEMLDELAPQVESAGGGAPVILLEGKRISSFREVAKLPAEAIARVDILPEEVALKYGYAATQKIVNIVLRQHFYAITTEMNGKGSARGDALRFNPELGFLAISRGERINVDVEYKDQSRLLESDRGIVRSSNDSDVRTLIPAQQTLELTGTYHKPINDQWGATLNGAIVTDQTQALQGSAVPRILLPASSPYSTTGVDTRFSPLLSGYGPLERSRSSQTEHVGLAVNGSLPGWELTFTGNYDHGYTRTLTSRPLDLTAYAAAVAAGDPSANPSNPVDPGYILFVPGDEARNLSDVGAADVTAVGSPIILPAGDVTTTIKLGGSMSRFSGTSYRLGGVSTSRTARDLGEGSLNIDIPISSDAVPLFEGLGRLSVNGNAALQHLSDYGSLRTLGGGLTWAPSKRLNIIVAYRDEENAPSASQIADPLLVTSNVDIFDYTRGQSVQVSAITGGNPNLVTPGLRNLRIGATWRLGSPDIKLRLDYNNTRQRNQIAALPGATPAVIAAFPGRFVRNTNGDLTSVDLRPINIASEDREQIRWGVNFTKRLKASQAQIDAMRAEQKRRFPTGMPQGKRGGGPGGGRLSAALFHTWVLRDRATLAAGQAPIDLLSGGTITSNSGPSRHRVQVRFGASKGGYGARLKADWQSGTRVDGIAGFPDTTLNFGSLATVDLKLFADFNQMPTLTRNIPFFRNSRLKLSLDNLVDERQKVTNGTGITPLAYQSAYIDPLGRTVKISFRKLFNAR